VESVRRAKEKKVAIHMP